MAYEWNSTQICSPLQVGRTRDPLGLSAKQWRTRSVMSQYTYNRTNTDLIFHKLNKCHHNLSHFSFNCIYIFFIVILSIRDLLLILFDLIKLFSLMKNFFQFYNTALSVVIILIQVILIQIILIIIIHNRLSILSNAREEWFDFLLITNSFK